MKKNERYAFHYDGTKEQLLQSIQISSRVQQGRYLYEETENGFALGIGRGSHTMGYWYLATVKESNTGCDIRGSIKAGNLWSGIFQIEKETLLEKIGFVFLIILFLPILIPFWCVVAFRRYVMKKKDDTYEDVFDEYMISNIGCRHQQ
jgi:hypothetical protein